MNDENKQLANALVGALMDALRANVISNRAANSTMEILRDSFAARMSHGESIVLDNKTYICKPLQSGNYLERVWKAGE